MVEMMVIESLPGYLDYSLPNQCQLISSNAATRPRQLLSAVLRASGGQDVIPEAKS